MPPVCVECGRIMYCSKTGRVAQEESAAGISYRIWHCDEYQCPGCGKKVLVGFSKKAMYPSDEGWGKAQEDVEVTFI